MGAPDWTRRMAMHLEDEFGTPDKQNLHFTVVIRWLASDHEYVFGAMGGF